MQINLPTQRFEIMNKFLVGILLVMLSTGIAFAGGGKVRGDEGSGTVTQEFCGPNDDCAGDPYWWE